jgi:hypothetical protein
MQLQNDHLNKKHLPLPLEFISGSGYIVEPSTIALILIVVINVVKEFI